MSASITAAAALAMSSSAHAAAMAERPVAGPPRPYRFPDFERRTLDNGMQLIVAPVRLLPVVTVLAVVEAGASSDPAGKEGLAHLAAALLQEGTVVSDGGELTDRVEQLGAALDAYADWDTALVKLTTLAPRLDEAMALLGEVITTPSFPEREVERLRAERLAEILQSRTEPRGLADELFERLLYVKESRFATPSAGSETSIRGITREEIIAFHALRYRPGGTTLIVVGDVSIDDAMAVAERTLGAWRGQTPPPVVVNDAPARLERGTHLIAKHDAAQSEFRLGHVGLPRLHPDYFSVLVMNSLLGGVFNSRLNMNLRERHGYTYGAHSAFDWRRAAGPFVAEAAVQSEVTAAAIREALGEIERFSEAPPPDREFTLAIDYLDGVFPIRFETTGAIASALAGLVAYGLPEDYYDTYRARVRAVTPESVQQAARDHLRLDRLQLVVVGNPAAVREPLEALGVGPLQVYDAAGRPIG